jgi:hypothetical protein
MAAVAAGGAFTGDASVTSGASGLVDAAGACTRSPGPASARAAPAGRGCSGCCGPGGDVPGGAESSGGIADGDGEDGDREDGFAMGAVGVGIITFVPPKDSARCADCSMGDCGAGGCAGSIDDASDCGDVAADWGTAVWSAAVGSAVDWGAVDWSAVDWSAMS